VYAFKARARNPARSRRIGFGRFHAVGFDGFINLRRYLPLEFISSYWHCRERLDMMVFAFDDFLDVLTGRFVGSRKT